MANLECTIFNVDHGFAAFIRSPGNYGLLIDFGSRAGFSPVKWIRGAYNLGNGNVFYHQGRRIAEAVVTHLHKDHFDDVGSLKGDDKPKLLIRDKETLPYLEEKILEDPDSEATQLLRDFREFQAEYTGVGDPVAWGFDYFDYTQISLPSAQEVSAGRDNIINNRSYLIAVGYGGNKILFTGDIEVEGWEEALKRPKVQQILSGTNFFVASHHGHRNGFTSAILDYSGIPDVYLVSAKSGDTHIDTSYSNSVYSHGFIVNGDLEPSHMISTRARKGSIHLNLASTGHASIHILDTPDNLNENQRRLRARRTRRLVKSWE